uniref:Methyltransferase type 11 domain-containing protein n=1 Tax=Plectus sambesii TaxID=2011161 RepID=A0A914WKJ4_9BILA
MAPSNRTEELAHGGIDDDVQPVTADVTNKNASSNETQKTSSVKFWDKSFSLLWQSIFNVFSAIGLYGMFWRPVYAYLALLHRKGVTPLRFMNYGFAAITEGDEKALAHKRAILKEEPEDEHTNINLYERTLALHPLHPHKLDGLDLLEISCGHGGGLQWIERAHPTLKSVRGMDMTIVDTMGGKVFQGNAYNVPLADESVDIVLNVESSHCYDDQPRFLRNCYRILRPGGYFLWTDIRPVGIFADFWINDPVDAGFELVGPILDWNEQIVKSLDQKSKLVFSKFSEHWYTRMFNFFWATFWGLPNTGMYRSIVDRKFLYRAAAWKKPAVQ